MQCEPSTSIHWEDCACNQACRTRSRTRACTMARPHCTECRPKSRAECLQGNWKHRGRKESCWWRRQSRGTSVWSRGQIKRWSQGSRPQITSAKSRANKCPKLLKLIIICCSRPRKGQTCTKADANVGKIISAFSHRQTTTSTSVQEETHWLMWHIFFPSEPVTLSERPVLMMPGHYVVYSTFIDEPHKEWLVRGLWARPSFGLA